MSATTGAGKLSAHDRDRTRSSSVSMASRKMNAFAGCLLRNRPRSSIARWLQRQRASVAERRAPTMPPTIMGHIGNSPFASLAALPPSSEQSEPQNAPRSVTGHFTILVALSAPRRAALQPSTISKTWNYREGLAMEERPPNWCAHCDSDSIREARVTTREPGWELDPPSLESIGKARACFKCLCQWTMAGDLAARGERCPANAP
jgi:hypothetical protein